MDIVKLTDKYAGLDALRAIIRHIVSVGKDTEAIDARVASLEAEIGKASAGAVFAGVATPATDPGTPDQPVFWLASQDGTYTGFGGAVVSGLTAFVNSNGTWEARPLGVPSNARLEEVADRQAGLAGRTEAVEADISALGGKQASLEEKQTSLETTQANLEDWQQQLALQQSALTQLQTVLERKQSSLELSQNSLSKEQTALSEKQATLESAQTALESAQGDLEAKQTALEAKQTQDKAAIETQLEGKADTSELSNIIGEPTDQAIGDIEPSLVTDALRKTPQALTAAEQAQVKDNLGISKMELFCDLFNKAAGNDGHASVTDGVFSCTLNGLELTYDEAVAVYNIGVPYGTFEWYYSGIPIKTNLPLRNGAMTVRDFSGIAYNTVKMQVLNLGTKITATNIHWFLYNSSIERVIGEISFSQSNNSSFLLAKNLREIQLHRLAVSVYIPDSPLLSLASFRYMVDNSIATSAVTVTVHPDVYAKLTDEANTEWHAVLTDGAEKNIVFATIE